MVEEGALEFFLYPECALDSRLSPRRNQSVRSHCLHLFPRNGQTVPHMLAAKTQPPPRHTALRDLPLSDRSPPASRRSEQPSSTTLGRGQCSPTLALASLKYLYYR